MSTEVDAVVIGGGPAGLTAALWLARYRRSVVVVDSEEYRARRVERSHGYLGRDPQDPLELLATGREELLAYPTASIERARVQEVRRAGALFEVLDHRAHRLVLACGVKDVLPDVEGVGEHYGSSLFHCPSCDGYEARDRDVVVLGWDEQLVDYCTSLLSWARSVTLVTDGRRFAGDDEHRERLRGLGIGLVERQARSLLGPRGDLRAICLDDGTELPASLAFFSIAHRPQVDLATALGCALDDDGYVAVSSCGQTSVDGVYAAGDLTPQLQLVSVAAASGAVAGVAAAQSFFGQSGAPTSGQPAP